MKLWVYSNSAFLLRAAIGFSRRLTLAGEASYSFSLYSIICCISCTYFHLMLVSGSFRKKPPHPRFFYYPVSSKNEGNLEAVTFTIKHHGKTMKQRISRKLVRAWLVRYIVFKARDDVAFQHLQQAWIDGLAHH